MKHKFTKKQIAQIDKLETHMFALIMRRLRVKKKIKGSRIDAVINWLNKEGAEKVPVEFYDEPIKFYRNLY